MSSSIHYSPDTRDKTAYSFLQDRETETSRLTYQELDRQAWAIAVSYSLLELKEAIE